MNELVGYAEARELLGKVSWATVHRLARAGELKPVRIGTRVFFKRREIEALIEKGGYVSTGEKQRSVLITP